MGVGMARANWIIGITERWYGGGSGGGVICQGCRKINETILLTRDQTNGWCVSLRDKKISFNSHSQFL